METMILGRRGFERTQLEGLLNAAGHGVHVCHDRDWGCVGLDGACPMDATDVDVAVIVPEPGGRFDAQGMACAHRARIPVVAIGADPSDPVIRHATAVVPHVGPAVIDALRRVSVDASGHVAAIEEALAAHTAQGETFLVLAERRPQRLAVQLVMSVEATRAAALADVARAAARAYDQTVTTIDVRVVAPAP